MNETKLLEERLRHWTPRRPSANVRKRVFGGEESPESGGWWLAPAAACAFGLLVLFTAVNHSEGTQGRRSAAFFALLDGSAAVPLGATAQLAMSSVDLNLEWNVWEMATFDWTNRQVSPSSMGSLLLAKTNLLNR